MRNSRLVLAGFALAALANGPAVLAANDGEIFKDWQVVCEKPAGADQDVCHISQGLASSESKQPILHIAVGYLPGQDTPAAIVTLPLGLALRPGIQIRIDGGEPQKLQPNVCLPAGCQTIMVLNPATLASMRKGNGMFIAFYTVASKEPRSVRISLRGFTAAFRSLQDPSSEPEGS